MLAEEVSEALSRATWCNPSSVRPSDEGRAWPTLVVENETRLEGRVRVRDAADGWAYGCGGRASSGWLLVLCSCDAGGEARKDIHQINDVCGGREPEGREPDAAAGVRALGDTAAAACTCGANLLPGAALAASQGFLQRRSPRCMATRVVFTNCLPNYESGMLDLVPQSFRLHAQRLRPD